jgi:DNA polymerase V
VKSKSTSKPSQTTTYGGSRSSAGRKTGTGLYGEPTQVMRIPQSAISVVDELLASCKSRHQAQRFQNDILLPDLNSPAIQVPLFSHAVAAGFPSPADDYVEARLSLDQHLIRHKDATFFVRAKGNSMVGAGIFDGDLLVVDKSLIAASGDIVIAVVDGDLTVKRLIKRGDVILLHPENPRFKDIEFKEGQELQVWGVVTSSVKKFI